MLGVSAQVSLYPLRSPRLGPAVGRALAVFHKHHLDVRPGAMSTLVSGDDSALFAALREAFAEAAADGQEVVMVVTMSNACPVPPASTSSGGKTA